MGRKQLKTDSVAEAYLALLADRGVEYLFANAGTDFAPIVEAYAKAAHSGQKAPKPLLATHENLALSMAHGYAAASGRVPAVMVHVSVGTANALCGVFNAARANVPILFTAGRSPLTEEGLPGARDTYIHWAQEMFDQAGMLREMVKWDYELKNGVQLETVIDRALTLATSPPEGPVYLSLPREVLAEKLSGFAYDSPARRVAASPPAPDEAAVAAAAEILASAQNPLIITADAGRDLAAVSALADFAERFAIPVVEHRQRYLCLPADLAGLGQRLPGRGARTRLDPCQRIHADAGALPVDSARRLFRVEPGGRTRLGRRRGARRQARGARPTGRRHLGRRVVPLREPRRGAPCRNGAPAAGAVRRRQQCDVGRGAARDARHVPAGRGGSQQSAAVYRSRRIAGFRAGLRRGGRLWRAGRRPGGAAGRLRAGFPRRQCREAAGIAQRHLPRALRPRRVGPNCRSLGCHAGLS